jgi:hypothetical protein
MLLLVILDYIMICFLWLFYWWLLLVIILMVISAYFIGAYIFYCAIGLVTIVGYSIGGY